MSNKCHELLYLTIWNFDNEESNGICKKIKSQFKAFNTKGFNTHLSFVKDNNFIIMDNDSNIIYSKITKNRFQTLKIVNDYLKSNRYRYVYIRYCLADRLFLNVCKTLHNEGSKTIVELPTYPYDNEFKKSLYERIGKMVDAHYRKKLHFYIDRIAIHADDKMVFKCPTLQFRNGLDVDLYKTYPPTNDDVIDLIAVAMFTNSHGYQRIIEGLHNYYLNESKSLQKIRLHLVGDGQPKEVYEGLVAKYNLKEYVKLYGVLQGNELEKVFSIADIGIDAIGLHNVNLKKAQTIKSNEYALRGLPMIAEIPCDLYSGIKQYEFVMPYDDSPLDVDSMLKWYNTFNDNQEIREEIRAKTEDKVNILNCFDSVYKFFGK